MNDPVAQPLRFSRSTSPPSPCTPGVRMEPTPDPLDEIEHRHAQLLDQLDELNSRIEVVLQEHTAGKGTPRM